MDIPETNKEQFEAKDFECTWRERQERTRGGHENRRGSHGLNRADLRCSAISDSTTTQHLPMNARINLNALPYLSVILFRHIHPGIP